MKKTAEPLLNHPYGFLAISGSHTAIIGSFPIAKFCHPRFKNDIKDHEIDFYYGGEKNLFWPTVGAAFNLELNSRAKIISFLKQHKICMGDIIHSCRSKKNSAANTDLYNVKWNTILKKQLHYQGIRKIYFTSNWVKQNFFKKIDADYDGECVVLLSPSGAANIAIAAREDYKQEKMKNPDLSVRDFRIAFYKKAFKL